MSSESLAVFRKHVGEQLGNLAEQHIKHDLQEKDRDALKSAASTVSIHSSVGSAIGVGLGVFLAYRLRSSRASMFKAFRAAEQPTTVRFANGREEPLPNMAPLMKPSKLGDFAMYTLLGAGGVFFGGETGLMTGTLRARQQIAADRDSRDRIQAAFRNFQADALRAQADNIEKGREAPLSA